MVKVVKCGFSCLARQKMSLFKMLTKLYIFVKDERA